MAKPKAKVYKTSQKLLIGLVAIIVIVIGAVLLGNNSKDKLTTAQNNNLLTSVQSTVEATYSNIAVNSSGWSAQMGSGIGLQAIDYDFQISSRSMPTEYFAMTDSPSLGKLSLKKASSPQLVSSIIQSTLHKAGYITNTISTYETVYNYKNNRCLSIFDNKQYVLTLSCYRPSDIVSAAKKLQPFAKAYTKANPKVDSTTTYYGPVVIKSQDNSGVITSSYTSSYDIAEALVQNLSGVKIALFYNKANGPWQYITQAGDEFGFSCNAYKANLDVRKAMYNQICLSSSGQVRLDTSNRALQ